MQYTKLGNTDYNVSRLGFGCMRLPLTEKGGKRVVDEEAAEKMLRKGYELGINYFDTAYFYHDQLSETILGRAMKGIRDKCVIVTKSPGGFCKEPGDYRRILEGQLERLQMSYVDFYHFHGINPTAFQETDEKGKWLEGAQKAKEDGLIKHISFSFHGPPEGLPKLVDMGHFESVLCQYNVLDRSNEEGIAYAKSKGLSVIAMGPLGGGRLSGLPKATAEKLGIDVKSSPELGLRFVASNPNIDVICSGMSSEAQLMENFEIVSRIEPLTKEELAGIENMVKENKRIAELYCTGCNYCMPCPQEVNIPYIFDMSNYNRLYGIFDYAKANYASIGTNPWVKGKRADACNDCGECETKCPQKIKIRDQLKETHKALA